MVRILKVYRAEAEHKLIFLFRSSSLIETFWFINDYKNNGLFMYFGDLFLT